VTDAIRATDGRDQDQPGRFCAHDQSLPVGRITTTAGRAGVGKEREIMSCHANDTRYTMKRRPACTRTLYQRMSLYWRCAGMTFLFQFPSHALPSSHSRSDFGQRLYMDYLKAEKYVYCVVNSRNARNNPLNFSISIPRETK